MITFAPGPSKVYDALPRYMQEAYEAGILSANHRSSLFMNLYQETEQLMREKLHLPEGYRLLFTSSATENWEIITQSVVEQASYHIYSQTGAKAPKTLFPKHTALSLILTRRLKSQI